LESNLSHIVDINTVKSAQSAVDRVGRDTALYARISDALVYSNSKLRIKALSNSELKTELSELNKKFEKGIFENVGKLLDNAPAYIENYQIINEMQKYIDEMIEDVGYLRTKYRGKINKGELI
jgi:hypothetical protein